MWEMPLWMLIALIVVISIAIYFLLRPLKVLTNKEFAVSHGFTLIGLALISCWLWLNRVNYLEMAMLIGGMWTVFGGFCFVSAYVLRKFAVRKGAKKYENPRIPG